MMVALSGLSHGRCNPPVPVASNASTRSANPRRYHSRSMLQLLTGLFLLFALATLAVYELFLRADSTVNGLSPTAQWHAAFPGTQLTRSGKRRFVRSSNKAGKHTAADSELPDEHHNLPIVSSRTRQGEPEIWAQGFTNSTFSTVALRDELSADTVKQLRALCGRCLYRTLTSYVRTHDHGRFTVVLTGDIPAVWLRDSAVQMATYLPRVGRRPALRQTIEGAIRAQAFFVLQDPWANAYNAEYIPPDSLPKNDRQLGRGGWVFTRNFELDSVAYFFNFLWNFHQTPGVWSAETLLAEPLVHDAVVTLLRLLVVEQRHEELSPYRYSELPREGLGPPAAYTGMVWSAFRPSDDPQQYSYNIPDNMYLWGSLRRLLLLNDAVWEDPFINETAARLMEDVHGGIQRHGIVEMEPGVHVYAYEVDGLGGVLADFDDPNLPSLLAMPLLGYDVYDHRIYKATRERLFSKRNPYYFEGSRLKGLGSPHTARNFVWPLATAVEAVTAEGGNAIAEHARLMQDLLRMASGNGLAHESVNVDNLELITRPEFGWANAMTVVAIEQLLGVDCDEAAEEFRRSEIQEREAREARTPPNGGQDLVAYYEQLEAAVVHV